jgi:hypothetical protein
MAFRVCMMALALGLPAAVRPFDSPKQPTDSTNAQCVERLQIPSYPYVARVSISSGALRAAVTLGERGEVRSQQFEVVSDPKNLKIFQPAVERALKASRFRGSCAGQTVRLTFRFKMGGADEVWFEAPATYEITALPPMVNTKGRGNTDRK